jgi:hypothetical protein
MIIRLTNLMKPDEAGKIIAALSGETHPTPGQPMLGSDATRRMGAEMRDAILKINAFSVAALPRRMTEFEIHQMDEGMSHAIPIDQAVVGAGPTTRFGATSGSRCS